MPCPGSAGQGAQLCRSSARQRSPNSSRPIKEGPGYAPHRGARPRKDRPGERHRRPNSRGRAMRRGARRCNARLSKARPSRRPQRTSSLHQIRRDAQPCRASHGSARHSKDRESGVTAYVNADHITAARGIDRQPVSMQVAARPVQSGRAERNLRTYKHGRP